MKRPVHKTAHPECPHSSWAACDKAIAMSFGQCRAMVGDREPRHCSNWAASESGWCGMHHASEVEKSRRARIEAEYRTDLNARIDAHLARVAADPWWWLDQIKPSNDGTRGLEPFMRAEPVKASVRKGPHRVG